MSRRLAARRDDAAWKRRAADLLLALLRVDTTPKASPAECATAEREVFRIVREELAVSAPDWRADASAIRTEIAEHPYFTMPYYANASLTTELAPSGAGRSSIGSARSGSMGTTRAEVVRRVYGGRSNLFVTLPNPGRPRLVINGHMDTVAPFLPVRAYGDLVFGRGAVDDKGPCLAMVLAAELLAEVEREHGVRPACEVQLQFVIDEEPGGNGSLSAALDARAAPPRAVMVCECTGGRIHPANRGAVWYEVTLSEKRKSEKAKKRKRAEPGAGPPGPRPLLPEAMAFVVGALEACGRRLRAESDHPLFPHRPVQTCHGRLGAFGEHPSRVNDYVAIRLEWGGAPQADVQAAVDAAVADYCREYGDKTQPGAGDKVLERHIRWTDAGAAGATLEVFGLAGHMGAVARLDGAITKAAAIIRRLVKQRQAGGDAWRGLRIELARTAGKGDGSTDGTDGLPARMLTMEGGQGFLPTHTLEDVCGRMRKAVGAGVREYLALTGEDADAIEASVTFEKLHNAAYARSPDGPAVRAMIAAAGEAGLDRGEPILGWDVSCDARIFAREFPDAEVLTFGPGELAQAHGNEEHIDIREVLRAAEALARWVLTYGP